MDRGELRLSGTNLSATIKVANSPVTERAIVPPAIARCAPLVCRQHLCDNGGDGADVAGAVGKQHGVTVLEGKRHDARIAATRNAQRRTSRISWLGGIGLHTRVVKSPSVD